MAYEQRDNSGSLFSNDRKEKDTHPDFKGTAMIDGVVYWVSGWTKHGQRGDFTSLAFKRKDEQTAAPRGPAKSQGNLPRDDMDDQIPFGAEFR